jgi:hypothetical protein
MNPRESPLFHSDLLKPPDVAKIGKASHSVRAVVAMPIAKEISEMAARVSLAPQWGEIPRNTFAH